MRKLNHTGKQLTVLFILLFGIILVVLFLAIVIYYIHGSKKRGLFFRYDEKLISSNESYIGVIDILKEKVSIVTYSGEEVSHVDIKEQYPAQIALGNTSYFLLYRWESEDGAGKIVQYDYQSNKIKECTVSDVSTIACRNQYLFIGDWSHEEEIETSYFFPFYKGFYANRYIEEEHFGNTFETLSITQEGWCMVGDVKMYYHEKGYFSTEPVWGDYPGTSVGDFTEEDKVWRYQAETKQETKNRELLIKEIANLDKSVQGATYLVREYQSGSDIYGVCNVLQQYIPANPLESKDVIKSYCYNITRKDNKIKIMAETSSCIAIIATKDIYIYQKENLIIRQNIKTGDEKIIYKFKNYFSDTVYVQGDYLFINNKDKCFFMKWNISTSSVEKR